MMRVGIGVGLRLRDVPVDPTAMLAGVADLTDSLGIQISQVDDSVLFGAVDGAALAGQLR